MSENLRLLVFMHCSGLAGAERSVLELVHQLRVDHDVAVTVVLPYDGPLRERLAAEGARTLIVEAGWWCEFDRHRWSQSAVTLLEAIRTQPAEFAADVVITMSITIPWGALAASVLRTPHVWYLRETGDYLPFLLPFERIIGVIDESSNAVIAISHAVRRVVASIADDKISIVAPHFPGFEEPAPRRAARDRARPRLVYPGTKSAQKGQEDAIHAVAALAARGREVDLVLVGPGPDSENERLAAMAVELGVRDRVEISGFRDDVLDMIADADVMVDCTRDAALGRVIMEAMLIGTPVVATRSGGARDLCQEGLHGMVFNPGDSDELARVIEAMLDDPAETADRVRRAVAFAREKNKRECYGPVVFAQLRSLVGQPNPTPQAWSELFVDLLTNADAARQVAADEAQRSAAAIAEASADREAARTECRSLAGESERIVAERDSARAEFSSLAVESERIAAEREYAVAEAGDLKNRLEAVAVDRNCLVAIAEELKVQLERVRVDRDELRGECDRHAREYSQAAAAYEGQIAAIEATLGWRTLQRACRVRDRFLPLGTRRRQFYSWIGRTFGSL